MNYFQLRCKIPFCTEYVYVDRFDYLADSLFGDYRIPVYFRKKEARHPDFAGYVMVFCIIPKKYVTGIPMLFTNLRDKMLLLGYKDYDEVCGKIYQRCLEVIEGGNG